MLSNICALSKITLGNDVQSAAEKQPVKQTFISYKQYII